MSNIGAKVQNLAVMHFSLMINYVQFDNSIEPGSTKAALNVIFKITKF